MSAGDPGWMPLGDRSRESDTAPGGLDLIELPPWYDIDEAALLRMVRTLLAEQRGYQAPLHPVDD